MSQMSDNYNTDPNSVFQFAKRAKKSPDNYPGGSKTRRNKRSIKKRANKKARTTRRKRAAKTRRAPKKRRSSKKRRTTRKR